MTHIRCKTCYGSGKIMGGGMIIVDCEPCDGRGKILDNVDNISIKSIKIDKNSKSYKTAIKKIKELDSSITDDKAQDIFDKEFYKLED